MSTDNRARWGRYILQLRDESKVVTMFNVPTTEMTRDELIASCDMLFREVEHYRNSYFAASKRMFDGYK